MLDRLVVSDFAAQVRQALDVLGRLDAPSDPVLSENRIGPWPALAVVVPTLRPGSG